MAAMKQSKKKKHPIKLFLSICIIVGSGCLLGFAAKELYATMMLRQSIASTQSEISQLQSQQAELEEEMKRLSDPDYKKSEAKENQVVGKEGDVFHLPYLGNEE